MLWTSDSDTVGYFRCVCSVDDWARSGSSETRVGWRGKKRGEGKINPSCWCLVSQHLVHQYGLVFLRLSTPSVPQHVFISRSIPSFLQLSKCHRKLVWPFDSIQKYGVKQAHSFIYLDLGVAWLWVSNATAWTSHRWFGIAMASVFWLSLGTMSRCTAECLFVSLSLQVKACVKRRDWFPHICWVMMASLEADGECWAMADTERRRLGESSLDDSPYTM